MKETPKIISMATTSGFDGPDKCSDACLFLLYDDGTVWRRFLGDRKWGRLVLPHECDENQLWFFGEPAKASDFAPAP